MPSMSFYLDEIKLELTGGVLQLEVDDNHLMKIVNSCMREIQRYISSTKIITVPYESCIDLSNYKINAISKIFRAKMDGKDAGGTTYDPVALGFYQLSTGGNLYNMNDFVSRYAAWNTMQQISNTLSTDLAYYYDDAEKKLYINTTMSAGDKVTIEYIPRYDDVSDITSDYWVDQLMKLCKASTKCIVGRIRSKFTQSNALWTMDGPTMLQEGTTELAQLRADLQNNTALIYPID